MQCKDIPDLPILGFIYSLDHHANCFPPEQFPDSVRNAMPPGVPSKLAYAKMRSLIRRGLVDGCCCGCRGDFELTDAGWALVQSAAPLANAGWRS